MLSIEQWGNIGWSSMSQAFSGCTNLIHNALDIPDLTAVNNMSYMFSGCSNLDGDLSDWEVNNITDMSFVFQNTNTFNSNISDWDVSSVQLMTSMFDNAAAFNQNLTNWDISSVTDMSNMLNNCSMSMVNYDATLIGWASLSAGETLIPSSISLGADDILYCNTATGRDVLTNPPYNWNIVYDNKGCFETQVDGDWSDGSVWLDGIVPTNGVFELVEIKHKLKLTSNVDVGTRSTLIDITSINGEIDLKNNNILLGDNGNITGEEHVVDTEAVDESTPGGYIQATNRFFTTGVNNVAGLGLEISDITGDDVQISEIKRYHYRSNIGTADPIIYRITGNIDNTCDLTITAAAAISIGLYRWTSSTGWIPNDGQDINAFSSWTTSNIALPVRLLYFEGQRINPKEVLLTWATTIELNDTGFELESSPDGINFQKIGFVEGNRKSSSMRSYEFLVNNSNASYYRLKQIDFGGAFTYSGLRFIAGSIESQKLIVYPNPTKGNINMHLENSSPNESLKLHLLDAKGLLIFTAKGSIDYLSRCLSDKLNTLNQGLYFLEIYNSSKKLPIKIILE